MKQLILCFDCGDTLADEGTQVFDEQGNVLSARPIPGAVEALSCLHENGWRLALIADGRTLSFENILKEFGLWDLFDARVISEEVGEEKPSSRMFLEAVHQLGLTENDLPRMVMFGNNLSRDILGANGMGMISVHLAGSPRYPDCPSSLEETPRYVTRSPLEWPALAEKLEMQLEYQTAEKQDL